MKIRWLDIAVDDLEDIADYIAQDNPAAAGRIVARLWDAVKTLTEHPEAGRPGRVYGTRELVVSMTPFIVPYRIVGFEIQILRVLHGARQWPESF
jgi:addiction module RelE/StbE family toxin